MAEPLQLTPDEIARGVKIVNGRKVRPGIGGALADAAEAIGKTFGPKSVTQNQARIKYGVSDSGG